jgi:hypothetical protein
MGDIPDEVVYGKLRFKINTGYISATIGPSSFLSKPIDFPLLNYGIDYRRPRDKEDAGYGKRKPKRYSNLSYSLGISYSFGWLPVDGKKDTLLYNRNPGVFAEFEYVYKPYYDIGIGPKVFINYDLSYPTYGVGISLYFSNSYKGKSRNINDSQQ